MGFLEGYSPKKRKILFILFVFLKIVYGIIPAILSVSVVATLYMVTSFLFLLFSLSNDSYLSNHVHTGLCSLAFLIAVTALLGTPLFWLTIVLLLDVAWEIGHACIEKPWE